MNHVLVQLVLLRIANQASVDTRQNAMRPNILGILFQSLFGLIHGVAQTSGLDIEVGQLFGDKRGGWVVFQSRFVVFHRFAEVVAPVTISAGEFGIHVTQRVVIVGIGFGVRRGGGFGRRLSLPGNRKHQQKRDKEF